RSGGVDVARSTRLRPPRQLGEGQRPAQGGENERWELVAPREVEEVGSEQHGQTAEGREQAGGAQPRPASAANPGGGDQPGDEAHAEHRSGNVPDAELVVAEEDGERLDHARGSSAVRPYHRRRVLLVGGVLALELPPRERDVAGERRAPRREPLQEV